jgi:hypothetical protein
MFINSINVVVVRDGVRRVIAPTGNPFAFTPDEVEAARAAGRPMVPYRAPTPVAAVEVEAAPAEVKPARGRRGKAPVADDGDDDGI